MPVFVAAIASFLAAAPVAVPVGAVGVVRIVRSTPEGQELELWFPSVATSVDAPARAIGPVALFDAQGVVARIPSADGRTKEWCENDGGSHFRAELLVKLRRDRLARALQPAAQGDGVVAFAVVEGGPKPLEPFARVPKGVLLLGSVGDPASTHAVLARGKADAGCGDRFEQDRLLLATPRGAWDLRCCGP